MAYDGICLIRYIKPNSYSLLETLCNCLLPLKSFITRKRGLVFEFIFLRPISRLTMNQTHHNQQNLRSSFTYPINTKIELFTTCCISSQQDTNRENGTRACYKGL